MEAIQTGRTEEPRTTTGIAGHMTTAAGESCSVADLWLLVCGCGFVVWRVFWVMLLQLYLIMVATQTGNSDTIQSKGI